MSEPDGEPTARRTFTNWDERYRRGEHANDAPLPLVVNAALQCQPGRALDLACGVGRHALWLAEHGWQVTAVDASAVAIEILRQRAEERGVTVEARVADLERGEFVIEPGAYNLIVVTCYLQRELFPAIRAGVRLGGLVVAVIALVDDDPQVKLMNPAFESIIFAQARRIVRCICRVEFVARC